MSAPLTAEQLAVCRATERRRADERLERRRRRRDPAWATAREAASLLREQYGASRVFEFDLVDLDRCREGLKQAVETEGVEDTAPPWAAAATRATARHPRLNRRGRSRAGPFPYCCPALRGPLTSPTNSSAPVGTWRMKKRNGRLSSRLPPMPAAIVTSVAAPALVPCSVTSM